MAKVLERKKGQVMLSLSSNEYKFLKTILNYGEITDSDFVFEKPAGKELLEAFK